MADQPDGERTVTAMAWYRPDQWERLLEVSADADELDATYFEWYTGASATLRNLQKAGVDIRPMDVDVEELLAWCRSEGRPLDGKARAAFVAKELHEQHREAR